MSKLFLLLLFTVTVAHADDTHGERIWPSPYAQGVELDQVSLFEDGQKVDLADLSDEAPVIAVRYLGYGCEHCVQQLTYLNEHASDLRKLGIRVIAFSEDDYELNERLISKMDYDRKVVNIYTDLDNEGARSISASRIENDTLWDLHAAMVIFRGEVLFSRYSEQPYMDVEHLVGVAMKAGGYEEASPQAAGDNAIDKYLSAEFVVNTIAGPSDGMRGPTDLDFNRSPLHPNDLWVVNTDNLGYSIAIFHNATSESERALVIKKDSRASHFMWRTMGIAMGSNGSFGTAQNGENGGGDPFYQFMGPTLWSADSAVFAEFNQESRTLLGSHLDMLHQSPICYGIAHEVDNVYWVSDGYNGDVARFDFSDPHEFGGHDHRDGRIRRFPEAALTRGERGRPAHMAMDAERKWLYYVDPGSDKVVRLDITTGSKDRDVTPPRESNEPLAEYTSWTGATVEDVITEGIGEPVGLEVYGNRLMVGDRKSGKIFVYEIGESGLTALGSIETGASELTGFVVGPNQRIWFCDRMSGTIGRLDTEVDASVTSMADVVVSELDSEIEFEYYNPAETDRTVEFAVNLYTMSADGESETPDVTETVSVMIPAQSQQKFTVTPSLPDNAHTYRVMVVESDGTTTGGVRAHTIVVPRNIQKVVVEDATVEGYSITEAIEQTDREGYTSISADVFVRVANDLDSLKVAMWNSGTMGNISVTDDAVIQSLIDREIEVLLMGDDPLIMRTNLSGSANFFRNFGASLRGAEQVSGDQGQRVFNGVVGDPISGGMMNIDCQLKRLDHDRGGSYTPNALFNRGSGSAIPFFMRVGSGGIGGIRFETGFRRSVIIGINASRFMDGFERTELLDRSLEWLEGAPVVDDTVTSVNEDRITASGVRVSVAGNPAITQTKIILRGEVGHVEVGLYTVTGQLLQNVYSGRLDGQMSIPVDVTRLARGSIFVIARTETGVTHSTFMKQ